MNDEPILTWFDAQETYHFLRDNHKGNNKAIPRLNPPIGQTKPYILTPELTRMADRKKHIRSLSTIFGNEYAQKILYFHLSLDRFLRLSMPINRLSSLVNETFFYFERYLYMVIAWGKDKQGFYRDHSLHAAHEAFFGYKILENFPGVEQKIKDFLGQSNNITRYLNDNCRIGLTNDENLMHIIYSTWFLSALFHDLGYVLSFNREVREKMLSFHRHSDLIHRADKSSFDDIQLQLGNSLLFNTIKTEELEYGYNENRHGTLSAFLLLTTFYSPPAFDGVDILDRAAIELAAHAIYCHDCGKEYSIEFKQKGRAKPPFGIYAGYFSNDTINLSEKIKKNLDKKGLTNSKAFKINIPTIKDKPLKRKSFQESPFAFYLRFIDELHVFGRNSLFFTTDPELIKNYSHFEESSTSYTMPFIRNLVLFPAQAIECIEKDNKLRVYYVADASLYHQKGNGKKELPCEDSSSPFNEAAIKGFLTELYWLKRSVEETKIFTDLEFYLIEIWPK